MQVPQDEQGEKRNGGGFWALQNSGGNFLCWPDQSVIGFENLDDVEKFLTLYADGSDPILFAVWVPEKPNTVIDNETGTLQ